MKIINDKVLLNTLHMIELHERQLVTAKKMVRAVEMRLHTLKELARATYTGDGKAFNVLAPRATADTVSADSYYPNTDFRRTRLALEEARAWRDSQTDTPSV